MILQAPPLLTLHYKKMPNMLLCCARLRQAHGGIINLAQINFCYLPAAGNFFIQVRELDTQHGSLNFIKAAIHAFKQIFILFMTAVVS